MQICCSYGLQLLAVETPEEAACLQQFGSMYALLFLLNTKAIKQSTKLEFWATSSYELWTSGTADGIGCERTWGWCPSGQPFYDNFTWGQSLNPKPGVENCVAIAWSPGNTVIFVDQVCSAKRAFICEVISSD
jgi:hypothetical protein